MQANNLVLPTLALLVLTQATHVSDFDMQVISVAAKNRSHLGYMYCPCSPSTITNITKPNVQSQIISILHRIDNGTTSNVAAELQSCTHKHSQESCINADSQLRQHRNKTLCSYDAITQRNIVPEPRLPDGYFITVGSCNEHRDMKSRAPIPLAPTNMRVQRGATSCSCSPSGELPPPGPLREIRRALSVHATVLIVSRMNECVRIYNEQDCINADRALRSSYNRSVCTYDSASGRNLVSHGARLVPVGTCSHAEQAVVGRGRSANGKETPPPNWLTEGCVAVEHLLNHRLQHPWHLRRRVLCHNGFCATPNHVIIVHGHYTSMNRLCATQWQCTSRVKLVNNLWVYGSRRVRVSDEIIVTPYDYRYPKIAVWLAQLLHDLAFLCLMVIFLTILAVCISLIETSFITDSKE